MSRSGRCSTSAPWTCDTRPGIENLLRELTPHVLRALVRRYGGFEDCEDAVQEALRAASVQWPTGGVPDNSKGWLTTTASRRRIELSRNQSARVLREDALAELETPDLDRVPALDDTLTPLLCCHPSLTRTSQVALTLRIVGGLTTAEIARALFVTDAAVAQRISRAKQRIKASGAGFELPPPAATAERITAVLHVLHLVFNEGYTASSGSSLHRVELSTEAIRLTRQLHRELPRVGEIAGLLALMLLTDARRPARTRPDGTLVPLAEQDRSLWDAALIAEGTALISATMARAPIGPYQIQAAIAAVHDEAAHADDTDWTPGRRPHRGTRAVPPRRPAHAEPARAAVPARAPVAQVATGGGRTPRPAPRTPRPA